MKRIYTLAFVALVMLTSCSVYRTNPTPDDVYYSPGAPADEQVAASTDGQDEYYSTPNDNYVRMRVQDPQRWSYFDDYDYDYYGGYSAYGFSPYTLGLSLGFGYNPWMMGGFGYYSPFSFWNSYYAWNSFYNPYYGGVVVVNGKNFSSPVYTRLGSFNPASYQNRSTSNRPASASRFYNGNNPSNNSIRRSSNFNTGSNYSNRPSYSRPQINNTQPVRTAPSSFGGGGGGGSFRGGGGGVRPAR
jgi:hypothetical protein